jgi:hypothetical protein
VLTKGLIGIFLPAGIIAVYLATTRRWYLLKEMRLTRGIGFFLAVAVPWFVLVSLRNPEFTRFFFIHEHLERFLTKIHGHYHPFWFFLPVLLATMFPWSLYAVRAVARAWGERRHPNGDRLMFLLAWTAFIFFFFSASHSKLVPYILPVFPPLALLTGKMFSDAMDLEQRRLFGPENAILTMFLVLMAEAAIIYPHVQELAPLLTGSGLMPPGSSLLTKQPILSPAGGTIVAGMTVAMGTVTWLAGRTRGVLMLFAGLCLGSYFLATIGLQVFMEGIELKKSSKELALQARRTATPDSCLVSFGYEQSLPFYTGKRVVVVGNRGELEFGSRQGNQLAWFIEEPDFMRLWQGKRPVVVMLKRTDYERITPRLVPPAMILGLKGKKMLICNRMVTEGSELQTTQR